MMLNVLLLSLLAAATGFQAQHVSNVGVSRTRVAASPSMKGRGTRGMPGKGVRPPPGSGMQKNLKDKMSKKDFQRSEWTLVAEKGELGSEFGASKAVEAGMSPQGQNYIWALVRGDDGDAEGSTVYATDGSCRACTFPMTGAKASMEGGVKKITCPSCGTSHDLESGEPIEWLPGNGPIQWAAQQLNKAKEPANINLMMTRVSRAGRIYIRLPDGTLPIAKTAAQRAAELAGKQEE